MGNPVKLTRHEIGLLVALLLALAVGASVKRFRDARPVPLPPAKSISQK
jgi:hypothetical protein